MPDDLVVGRHAEVVAGSASSGQRGGPAGHARERVVEEAEPGEEADRPERVAEEDGDVVLVDVAEVVDARPGDLVAEPVAEVPADHAEDRSGEEVEPDQAAEASSSGAVGRARGGR